MAAAALWLVMVTVVIHFIISPLFWRFGIGSQTHKEHLLQCAIPLRYCKLFVASPPPEKLAPHQMGKRALVFTLEISGVFRGKCK